MRCTFEGPPVPLLEEYSIRVLQQLLNGAILETEGRKTNCLIVVITGHIYFSVAEHQCRMSRKLTEEIISTGVSSCDDLQSSIKPYSNTFC